MGRKAAKKHNKRQERRRHPILTLWAVLLLLTVSAAALYGLGLSNARAKPRRDMQWFVQDGAVQVAAPAVENSYITSEGTYPKADSAGADGVVTLPEAAEPAATEAVTATEEPTAEPEPEQTPEPTQEPGPVTITISAAGDCTLGGNVHGSTYKRFAACVSKNGYDYFLSGVKDVFESDDLTIVNLEGPLTTGEQGYKHSKYNFRGDPEYVNILTSGSVELCNVANNHALDFGTAGLQETAQVLEAAGIGCSGFTRVWNGTVKGVRVCSMGFYEFTDDQILQMVNEARGQCDLLIVSVHWGIELRYKETREQRSLGHKLIDAGVDVVLGTHPHVIGGIEKYNGKYIVYSLGNFCFGGNNNPKDKGCIIFQQSFGFDPDTGVLSDEGINIIPCRISSVTKTNDYRPIVLPSTEGAALLKTLAGYSKNFNLSESTWMANNYLVTSGLLDSTSLPSVAEPADDGLTEEERLRRQAGQQT